MAKKKTDGSENRYALGRRIALGVILGLVIVVSLVGACTVFFRVESVQVEGNERYSLEQVLGTAAVEEGSNLILTPKEQIAQRIYEGLPYVENVKIQKRFPTTLRIVITEAQPAAVITAGEAGTKWIIDARGRALEQADESLALSYLQASGITFNEPTLGQTVTTEEGSQTQLDTLTSLLQALEDQGLLAKITEVSVASRTEVVMVYNGWLKVKILTTANFQRKLQALQDTVAIAEAEGWGRATLNMKGDSIIFSGGEW
jgi:cell division protein FtsQ